ncbi:Ankyrin repeat domain-containing protein 50 [Colletotrichum siamense]|nr:Ankyrin repeat domain-containing protein 50 [Colletotrichum siamense]
MELEMSDAFDGTPLTFAACRGLDEVVELLLDHGANIEAVGKDGRSPLFRAAHLGHVSTVKTLQHYGAKSPVQCGGPLELWPAPKNNFWLIIELLIIGGANIESRNERGLTLLSSAARAGQLPLLVMLLDRKADIETRDGEGRTPLWHALWNNQESTFEMLLRRGAKIEVVDRNGDTPLIYAARYGTASILQTLLSFGAQIEARNSQGRTPLWNAIYNRHASALETLLNRNAMIEAKDRTGRTSLSLAAEIFNPSALKTLLKYGAVVEALDKNHRTPLWYAAAAGSVACAVVLKENGADINCRDMNDMTPVMKAVEEGQWPVLEELLKFGGDIGCCDKFGRTALLIGAGADCNSTLSTDDLKNKRNHGELERSHYHGDFFVASAFTPILSGHQGLSEARDSQGRTALWWAIATGNPLLSKRISEVADEVEVVDMRGRPPLLSTATKGVLYKEIAQLLLEHVCQFGPEGKRLNSQEDVTQRAIRYVTSFLQFNDIDPNKSSMKDWWLGIKPGKPIEQLIA